MIRDIDFIVADSGREYEILRKSLYATYAS